MPSCCRPEPDDDGSKDGGELACQSERNDASYHAFSRELPKADDRAHREGHPREKPDERDDKSRPGADEINREKDLRGRNGGRAAQASVRSNKTIVSPTSSKSAAAGAKKTSAIRASRERTVGGDAASLGSDKGHRV